MNKLSIIFFIFFVNASISQSLSGIVKGENGAITNAFVLLNSEKPQFSKTDKNGFFEFKKNVVQTAAYNQYYYVLLLT